MPDYHEKVRSLTATLVLPDEDAPEAMIQSTAQRQAPTTAVKTVHELMGLLSTYRPPW
jgi:hypothetical protein